VEDRGSRRFTLLNAMILIGATAVGFAGGLWLVGTSCRRGRRGNLARPRRLRPVAACIRLDRLGGARRRRGLDRVRNHRIRVPQRGLNG
jgi:hypothetical protein